MDKENNMKLDADWQATTEEQGDIRSALNRMDVEAPDVDMAWKAMSQQMGLQEKAELHHSDEEKRTRSIDMTSFLKVAISIAAVVVIAFVFFFNGRKDDSSVVVQRAKTEFSSETSSDTKSVVRKDSSHGDSEDKSEQEDRQFAANEILVAETGRGEDRHLVLSDGTKVWLNAESSLLYPKHFAGKERKVQLQGEGYFEVRHNAKCPFIVEAANLIATDLGTAFGIKVYIGKPAQVTLVSGCVAVRQKGESSSLVLKPNQMATLSGDGFDVTDVDTYPLVQRKSGLFYFHEVALVDVMKELGRWYHVKVVFENKNCLQTQVHFVAERKLSLEEVVRQLNELEGIQVVKLKQELLVR